MFGPNGTFSHQAAMEWSEGKEEIKEFSTIYSVILAVEKGEIDRAIVPIENSIDGSINTTLDTLAFDVDLYITGEYILHISENLMVKKRCKERGYKNYHFPPSTDRTVFKIIVARICGREN